MGKVILGAIVGAVVGLGIGSLPEYRNVQVVVATPNGTGSASVVELLRALSMMIGTGAGAIVGAIAGRVAADPSSTRLPKWVLIVVPAIVIGLVVLLMLLWLFRSSGGRAACPPLRFAASQLGNVSNNPRCQEVSDASPTPNLRA